MANQPAEQQPTPEKKSKFRLIIILLLGINMLAVGAAVGYFMFIKPASTGEPPPPKMATFELGSMLVNLADPSGQGYLRFHAIIEYPEKNKKLLEEMTKNKHIMQHAVIALLRQKRLAEVRPPDSVEKVQQEMTEAINQILEHGEISRIYFTEYITQ